MPTEERQAYERIMGAVDANRNGIPDVLEPHGTTAGQQPTVAPGPLRPPAPAALREEPSFSKWTVLCAVLVALAILGAYVALHRH